MGECRDIDECFLQTHACLLTDGQEKVFKILDLSGQNWPVFHHAGYGTCFIINLAKDCLNTPGSYVCPCLSGYGVDVAPSIGNLGKYYVKMTSYKVYSCIIDLFFRNLQKYQ